VRLRRCLVGKPERLCNLGTHLCGDVSFRPLGKRHHASRNNLLLPMFEVSEHISWFIPGSCQEIWETLHSLTTLLTCTNDDRGKTTLKGNSVSDTTMLSRSTCHTKSLPDAHSPTSKYSTLHYGWRFAKRASPHHQFPTKIRG